MNRSSESGTRMAVGSDAVIVQIRCAVCGAHGGSFPVLGAHDGLFALAGLGWRTERGYCACAGCARELGPASARERVR